MMTTSEAILNYASIRRGVFCKRDLIAALAAQKENINVGSVDSQLARLIASGNLQRRGRSEYMLAGERLPNFVYLPNEEEKSIFLRLREDFPFLDMCIWSPKLLSAYMLHIPNIAYTFVDVEKDGTEAVFHCLQNMNIGRNVLLAPTQQECDRYLTGTDAIVVRQLIGQSPLIEVDGCTVPRMEKILVDAIGDVELQFAGGTEIYNIYSNVRERNYLNMSALMRYASRRNRKTKLMKILQSLDNDKSSE